MPTAPVIVTSCPETKKFSAVDVTTPGLACDTSSMYAVIVPLGVQERFPRPSVSIVYPIEPPSI